jgi:hypothetical protein
MDIQMIGAQRLIFTDKSNGGHFMQNAQYLCLGGFLVRTAECENRLVYRFWPMFDRTIVHGIAWIWMIQVM